MNIGLAQLNPTVGDLAGNARKIIDAQDARGAWITSEGLRYHDHAGPVIDMKETVANLRTLADFLDTAAR